MRKEEIAGDIEALLDRWHESRSVGIAFMPDDWRTVIAALRASPSEAEGDDTKRLEILFDHLFEDVNPGSPDKMERVRRTVDNWASARSRSEEKDDA